MRQLRKHPPLPPSTTRRLIKETQAIKTAASPKVEAIARYKKARAARWFYPLLDSLNVMSGTGERCMFCSGSEASDLEHYRPKAVYPALTFVWENMLWACGICNRAKGNRFPAEPEKRLLNPTEENVWDYFFIDNEFGNLIAKWRPDLNDYDPRAISTMQIIDLGRQALQESRQRRLRDLKQRIADNLKLLKNGSLTKAELASRVSEWRDDPFQPDVADYFLNGPGQSEDPFHQLFAILK